MFVNKAKIKSYIPRVKCSNLELKGSNRKILLVSLEVIRRDYWNK